MMKTRYAFLLPLVFLSVGFAQNFTATPLTDFKPGQLYLGNFAGTLYENSNSVPADHAADGVNFAGQVQPLDSKGHPSPTGKIVVISIGMSNWTIEWCSLNRSACTPDSFLVQAAQNSQVNHTNLVLVNCAKGGQSADRWVDNSFGNYTQCMQAVTKAGVTDLQVQVILYKDALEFPTQSLTAATKCSPSSAVDACVYEHDVGQTARFVRSVFPNVKEMFLHSRIYGGYASPGTLNPEPFAYEYGFSTKWLIEAQVNQIRTGQIDPTAGDLSYSAAPWLAWGPYFWTAGPAKRSDGESWLPFEYIQDLTHPGEPGTLQVSNELIQFYLSSQFSPWFAAGGH
jgi:hypothetical protein